MKLIHYTTVGEDARDGDTTLCGIMVTRKILLHARISQVTCKKCAARFRELMGFKPVTVEKK